MHTCDVTTEKLANAFVIMCRLMKTSPRRTPCVMAMIPVSR